MTADTTDTTGATGATAAPAPGEAMSTAPVEDLAGPRGLGPVGWLRWVWRQLTSMRTALILLFLLAVAAIPGSVFPQRVQNLPAVNQYLRDSPTWGPVLDRLGFFEVYSSPWFAATYVLLFVSLVGRVLPRTLAHLRVLRQPPPVAPRLLSRLAGHTVARSTQDPQQVLDAARRGLRSSRWRVRTSAYDPAVPGSGWVSAEKGYAREVGNLLFHLSLLGILAAVALGSLTGFTGKVIVKEGGGFADVVSQYDSFSPGRFTGPADLPPFSLTLDDFSAQYQRGGEQAGAPREFAATVTSRQDPDAEPVTTTIGVNEPLELDGVKLFLVGHGYAPTFTVTDAEGQVVFHDTVVFLPQDGNFTSTGVVKVPDSSPPLALQGFFLPTAAVDATRGPYSSFPGPDNPAVFLSAWSGDLGLDRVPNVYQLDTDGMKSLGIKALTPGQSWTMPGADGATVSFDGFVEFASFSVARDPGKEVALAAALLAILGLSLSLLVARRRIWVRARRDEQGATVVEAAGLTRSEHGSITGEVAALMSALPVATGEPPEGAGTQS
jgi:cytochrome c biogenesis protein